MSTPTAISKLFIVFNCDAGSKHSFQFVELMEKGSNFEPWPCFFAKTDRVMTDIYVFSYYFAFHQPLVSFELFCGISSSIR